jgi:hypothetical protein
MPFEYEEPGEDYEFFEEDGESFVTSYVGPPRLLPSRVLANALAGTKQRPSE